MRTATGFAVLALAAALTGCGQLAVATTPPANPGGAGTIATQQPVDELTPDPGAGGETQTYQVGEVIDLESDGAPWAKITVTKPSIHKSYGLYDQPQVKGNVFIQAFVTYKAVASGVTYNPFDWQVFAGDEAAETAFAVEGPKPQLSSGTLSKGRTATGWVLYEVPAKGKVVMSYGGGFGGVPVFEVVIRAK
jgi:hypothetical protein